MWNAFIMCVLKNKNFKILFRNSFQSNGFGSVCSNTNVASTNLQSVFEKSFILALYKLVKESKSKIILFWIPLFSLSKSIFLSHALLFKTLHRDFFTIYFSAICFMSISCLTLPQEIEFYALLLWCTDKNIFR